MKKVILFAACLVTATILITSCKPNVNQGVQSSFSKTKKNHPILITLNHMTLDSANDMESNFLDDRGIYEKKSRTNVWFSKNYIDSLDSLLHVEKKTRYTDGIRIYYSKQSDGHYNIILVSTSNPLDNTGTPVKSIHIDYFKHDAAFLNTAISDGQPDYGSNGSGALLYSDLYSNFKCPENDGCDSKAPHYVKCDTARDWVNNYSTDTNDKITTNSEWFDLNLIDEIHDELGRHKTADGLRIYLVKRRNGTYKYGFIVVTTETVGSSTRQDYFECTANLHGSDNGEQCPPNCNGTTWP